MLSSTKCSQAECYSLSGTLEQDRPMQKISYGEKNKPALSPAPTLLVLL